MGAFIPSPTLHEQLVHDDQIQDSMREVAEEGAEFSRRHARVDTGEMVGTIHVEPADEPGGYRIVVGTDHWIPNEYGTSDDPGQPFLRPALAYLHLKGRT